MTESNLNIKFSLVGITTNQFATMGAPPKSDQNTKFQFGFSFGIDKDNHQIGTFVRIDFQSNDKSFIVLEVGCHFNIQEADWKKHLIADDKKCKLPKRFATHLLVLTVGTARGILHAKTEGTPFNSFQVPLLNVSEIIKVDPVLD